MARRGRRAAIILALALAIGTQAKASDEKQQIDEYIYSISDCYNISPYFVMALVEQESSYRPKAANGNCKGLMQVNESIHEERMNKLGVTDLYDPYSNLLVGIDYLEELFVEYEDPYEVLMFYNMGYRGLELYEEGIYSEYAEDICNRAMILTEENE